MDILIKPILTERMTAQGDKLNRYGFIVDPRDQGGRRSDVRGGSDFGQHLQLHGKGKKPLHTCRFVEWPRKQLQEGVCDAQRRRQDRFLQ
jgi:hypothetical protein